LPGIVEDNLLGFVWKGQYSLGWLALIQHLPVKVSRAYRLPLFVSKYPACPGFLEGGPTPVSLNWRFLVLASGVLGNRGRMEFLNSLDSCLIGTTKIVTELGCLLGNMISYHHPRQDGSWQVGRSVALLNPRVLSRTVLVLSQLLKASISRRESSQRGGIRLLEI